ncbi:xanthine dehydrogenase, molybdenum binding subunit apoprotein [Faunimonas pinastri]|uniref:Xanthine dehydrogenase, molybdenum binding subunit apoprotein n=1 Tax=Faunimonas pinastri TaxID=1855383 RepID=A0A1H9FF24_9HYPH|nr:xanthine dehydrogenase family protein molybdopterin-binding subunit [Faunimonas pinastri]SEQ35898.1 xanthine dehydrogenase, molybdenum binding subunit apoprotein [Faunimonas pinastri]
MTDHAPLKFGMGASVRRIEDESLIRGKGRYTADVTPEGCLHAFLLRSGAGHARLRIGDLRASRELPGVHLVWTGADVTDIKPLPCDAMGKLKPGTEAFSPEFPVLAGDTVRYVGEAIAFVVADDLETARSAAELIEVDYEMLPAVVDTARALEPDAPLVWPEHGSNVAFEYELGDAADTAAAFAKAAGVAEQTIVNNRVVSNYLEPRAAVAEFDAQTGRYSIVTGTQGVHGIRSALAKLLDVDEQAIHVRTYDVGGGFGTKAVVYREYPLVMKAARVLGRPVKWVCDRNEHFLADSHGRDNVARAAMALDAEGRILAMRVDLTAAMGAYFSPFGPYVPYGGITMTTGVYDIPAAHIACKGVFTNTVPVDAYRGAGRPEAAYLVERLIDQAARVAGLTPEEIRRRNFIRPEQMPYKTQGGRTYDTGEFEAHMDAALAEADAAGFPSRLAESRERGRIRGFGLATYIEACAFPGSEPAKLVLEGDGTVTLHIGTQANGQGHHTAYAQFVAGHLGLDYSRIRVVQGDSDALPTGGGTGGSRSIPIGVPSVDRGARMLAEQIRELAADELEASAGDIELVDGVARIVGTDREIGYAEVALRASDRTKLVATGDYETKAPTFPNGTHVCELEIDPETGLTHILRYVIVDDFGAVVNPMLLAGQVHGGVAQGIGQALHERTVYDGDGQLLSATLQDYALPRAWDVPVYEFSTRNVPSKSNAMGIKGAGEAGTIGAAPAVMNAVVDALSRAYGITHIDMPATPLRIWETIQLATSA